MTQGDSALRFGADHYGNIQGRSYHCIKFFAWDRPRRGSDWKILLVSRQEDPGAPANHGQASFIAVLHMNQLHNLLDRFWSDSLALPLYVVTASVVVLVSQLLWHSSPGLKLRATWFKSVPEEPEYAPETHSIAAHIENHGGRSIFVFKAARLVGCLALLSLSLVSLVLEKEDEQETEGFAHPRRSRQAALCATYVRVLSLGLFLYNDLAQSSMFPFLPLCPWQAARVGVELSLRISTRLCSLHSASTSTAISCPWPHLRAFPRTCRKDPFSGRKSASSS